MQAERSASVSCSQHCILSAIASKFPWVTGTRLKVPVVPDVLKMQAQESAVGGGPCLRRPVGLVCSSATSITPEGLGFATVKRPHPSPAKLLHLGRSSDTIKASRRRCLSSAFKSVFDKLGLSGTKIPLQ